MPILVLVWVRSFIEPGVLRTMYRLTIPLPLFLLTERTHKIKKIHILGVPVHKLGN